jgi:hypothetical protein
VEKLRRNRPSSLLKVKCREVAVRSRREASQVCEAVKESCGEILFFISWIIQGRTDVQIHPRRFVKFRGSLDLAEVQGGYSEKIPNILKLRRGRAVDLESQESLDLHVVSCIGDS